MGALAAFAAGFVLAGVAVAGFALAGLGLAGLAAPREGFAGEAFAADVSAGFARRVAVVAAGAGLFFLDFGFVGTSCSAKSVRSGAVVAGSMCTVIGAIGAAIAGAVRDRVITKVGEASCATIAGRAPDPSTGAAT